ncbi:Extradiol aromatic ring-opening dioxygenase [Nadsonia fulvescens var. elongata DSM 6958]|uniref:Extradiol aromatic ring-opening dioxygenase n=1 Tax=Nadsonia fulvescens var. elongata DSM 6958 TaxID=857566 RepID=A0A1E3PLT5_9ASCO|nr:Extradiol aromatic ring-opening dioxygenase [Nadsonia fulvescens var. elongata DSM 6958]
MYEDDPMGDKGAFNHIRKIGSDLLANPPKALVILSAHWQAEGGFGLSPRTVRITHRNDENPLIYDFYGFPKHMYEEKFKSRGDTKISSRIYKILSQSGFQPKLDTKRGLDHGVFVPLKVAFKNSSNEMLPFPVIQISLLGSEDPESHFELGQALSSLRDEGMMIIGSGMSVHNLRDLGRYFNGSPAPYVKPFDDALKLTVETANPSDILESLIKVLERPDARKAHPTFEHILPIVAAAGAADKDNGKQLYSNQLSSLAWGIFKFGN